MIITLKLLLFDTSLSVNRNQACVSCHMPETGWPGPVSTLNATPSAYPGSIRTRSGSVRRKATATPAWRRPSTMTGTSRIWSAVLGLGRNAVVRTDVTDRAQVTALVDQAVTTHGCSDAIINNTVLMPLAPLELLQVDKWGMIDVNIKGVLYGIAAALPHMKAQKRGHVITVSSVPGHKICPGGVVISVDAETTLRDLAIRSDIIKTTHKALATDGVDRPIADYTIHVC